MKSTIHGPSAPSVVQRPSFGVPVPRKGDSRSRTLASRRWLCATALVLACAQASAQSATITFHGVIVDGTTANHNELGLAPMDRVPRRTSTQALDDIVRPRPEILDYFAERSSDAGISSDRLRLVRVDYL